MRALIVVHRNLITQRHERILGHFRPFDLLDRKTLPFAPFFGNGNALQDFSEIQRNDL